MEAVLHLQAWRARLRPLPAKQLTSMARPLCLRHQWQQHRRQAFLAQRTTGRPSLTTEASLIRLAVMLTLRVATMLSSMHQMDLQTALVSVIIPLSRKELVIATAGLIAVVQMVWVLASAS